MDSWKFNSTAQALLRGTISDNLKIPYLDVYKTVKTFNTHTSIIETKDGKKYQLVLKEI